MDILLKDFQTATLDKLREYLGDVRLGNDPEQAFLRIARTENGGTPIRSVCAITTETPKSHANNVRNKTGRVIRRLLLLRGRMNSVQVRRDWDMTSSGRGMD